MPTDWLGPTTYTEATLPEVLLRPVGMLTREQYVSRYGIHITDRQILEARYGYLPIGATVHEHDWDGQQNAPMTINTKERAL